MINLQFKTNSLKIGSSVPSISLNYGRNLEKGLLLDQEKATRVDFSLHAVRNTCIVRPRYLVITEIKLKLKGKQKQIQKITRQLETEEHVDDYFTCIYIQLYMYTSAPCSTCVNFTSVRHQELVNFNVPTKR